MKNSWKTLLTAYHTIHTHNKKTCQPWATSAPASVAIRGSLPPIPAWRFHSIHRGRRSDRAVFVFSRGGVSSIAFYTSDSWSDFFWHRRRLPPHLPPPVAACRPFWGDARVNHTICGAAHARFAKIRAVGLLWAWKHYPSKKIGGKKIRYAFHGLCRRPWQSVARSGVTSVLATSELF